MTVKLVESHGHALALEGAGPRGYGLGRAGWVNVPLHAEGVTLELLCDWIEEMLSRSREYQIGPNLARRIGVRVGLALRPLRA